MHKLNHPPKWNPRSSGFNSDTLTIKLEKFNFRMILFERENGDRDVWITDLTAKRHFHFLCVNEVNTVNVHALTEIRLYINKTIREENMDDVYRARRDKRREYENERKQRTLSQYQRLQQRFDRHDEESRPLIASAVQKMCESKKTTK